MPVDERHLFRLFTCKKQKSPEANLVQFLANCDGVMLRTKWIQSELNIVGVDTESDRTGNNILVMLFMNLCFSNP